MQTAGFRTFGKKVRFLVLGSKKIRKRFGLGFVYSGRKCSLLYVTKVEVFGFGSEARGQPQIIQSSNSLFYMLLASSTFAISPLLILVDMSSEYPL